MTTPAALRPFFSRIVTLSGIAFGRSLFFPPRRLPGVRFRLAQRFSSARSAHTRTSPCFNKLKHRAVRSSPHSLRKSASPTAPPALRSSHNTQNAASRRHHETNEADRGIRGHDTYFPAVSGNRYRVPAFRHPTPNAAPTPPPTSRPTNPILTNKIKLFPKNKDFSSHRNERSYHYL